MKILFVSNSHNQISETFIRNKIIGLSARGCDVEILTHEQNTLQNDGSMLNCKIIYSPVTYSKLFLFFYLTMNIISLVKLFYKQKNVSFGRKLKTSIKSIPMDKKYDIIYFTFSSIVIQYMPILEHINSKIVFSCRGTAEKVIPFLDENRQPQLKKLGEIADLIHCVSNEMSIQIQKFGINKEKCFINKPSIDTDFFSRSNDKNFHSDPDKIVISTVARLHWIKDFYFCINFIKTLRDQSINVFYNIIGDGDELLKLKFLVKSLELQDYVKFYGSCNAVGVKNILKVTDIYLMGSFSEGINNSVLEAMAMEIPVVVSNVGGMGEVVNSDVGILFQKFKYSKLVNEVINLLKNKNSMINFGKNGRELVLKYHSIEKSNDKFFKKYNELIS